MSKFQRVDLSKYEKPSRFIKFNPGTNRIRVLSDAYIYRVVGKKTANGFVRHILEDGVKVPEFLQDVEPKLTYGFVVYSFDSGHFHVLETGPMLGHQLTEGMKEIGDEEFKTVDFLVHKSGEKLKTVYEVTVAEKAEKMPEGVTKESPEFRYILSYFEGLR